MNETVTHVAGPVVTIAGRSIQRCPVCGEKLCDSLGQAGPLEPDGSPPKFCHWQQKALVRVTSGNPTQYEMVGEFGDPMPDDFCLALVE